MSGDGLTVALGDSTWGGDTSRGRWTGKALIYEYQNSYEEIKSCPGYPLTVPLECVLEKRHPATYMQVARFEPPLGDSSSPRFGYGVAASGDGEIVAVGAPSSQFNLVYRGSGIGWTGGAVYLYRRESVTPTVTWTDNAFPGGVKPSPLVREEGTSTPVNVLHSPITYVEHAVIQSTRSSSYYFGTSVSLSAGGDRVAAGTPHLGPYSFVQVFDVPAGTAGSGTLVTATPLGDTVVVDESVGRRVKLSDDGTRVVSTQDRSWNYILISDMKADNPAQVHAYSSVSDSWYPTSQKLTSQNYFRGWDSDRDTGVAISGDGEHVCVTSFSGAFLYDDADPSI